MAKILIVEDERSIRQALRFELLDDGHEIHCAERYVEAENAINTFDYDLVISDIFLDHGNGMQLMDHAKKMNKQIPFIIITAFPDSDLALQIKAILKDRFFEKPFFTTVLKQKVSELLKSNFRSESSPQPVYSA
jgi:two-component system response regulator AtoC